MTVSVSWCRAPSGAHDQIFVTVWQLLYCLCGAPSLAGRQICHLLVTMCSSKSVVSMNIINYLHLHVLTGYNTSHVYIKYMGPLSIQALYIRLCMPYFKNSSHSYVPTYGQSASVSECSPRTLLFLTWENELAVYTRFVANPWPIVCIVPNFSDRFSHKKIPVPTDFHVTPCCGLWNLFGCIDVQVFRRLTINFQVLLESYLYYYEVWNEGTLVFSCNPVRPENSYWLSVWIEIVLV
jgi:hypothetical protein